MENEQSFPTINFLTLKTYFSVVIFMLTSGYFAIIYNFANNPNLTPENINMQVFSCFMIFLIFLTIIYGIYAIIRSVINFISGRFEDDLEED